MAKDRIKDREDGQECDACHYPAKKLTSYPSKNWSGGPTHPDAHHTLCELCASTKSGSALEYPTHYPNHSAQIMAAVCFVGNLILDKVEEKK